MLKVRSPNNLQNLVITDQPTSSKTTTHDDNITKTVDNSPSTSTFVATNNKDYYISYTYEKPVLDDLTSSPVSHSPTSPSKSDTDRDGFKVPFPVKPTTPRISVRSDIRTSETPSSSFISSRSFRNSSIIEELFGTSQVVADDNTDATDYIKQEILFKSPVYQNSNDTTNNLKHEFLFESPKYQKKTKVTKKKRTKKEDMPLSQRVRSREYKNLRRAKMPAENEEACGQYATDEDPWTEEEKIKLYEGMKKYGHFDLSLLKPCVPRRTEKQIRQFIIYQERLARSKSYYQYRGKAKVSYVAGRLAPQSNHVAVQFKQNQEVSPFSGGEDYQFWIDFLREVEEKMQPDYLRERRDLLLNIHRQAALGHALHVIQNFERHPPLSDTGGVDIKAAYKFLWCCFTHQALPRMNQPTRQFLTEQFEQLRFGLVGYMDDFKKKIVNVCTPEHSNSDESSLHPEDSLDNDPFVCKEADESFKLEDEEEEEEFHVKKEEGMAVLDSATLQMRRYGLWRPVRAPRLNRLRPKHFVFRHGRDQSIPDPDPSLPSTLSHALKNSVFNPLSLPLSTLQKEKR